MRIIAKNLFALALIASLVCAGGDADAAKRALIVAIGDYEPETGWKPLSSNRDYDLIRAALELHGFEPGDIHRVPQTDADRSGIVGAFRRYLIDPSKPGDVVVFHYSGHGQQITDNNRDELDGYDETIVPRDAPLYADGDYTGQKHLRDDDIGKLLLELRKKIGPTGDVLVFLDSCYSGTATRGAAYPEPVRGTMAAIGEPQAGAMGYDSASGFVDEAALGTDLTDPLPLSPMVVFSAETHNRLAEETTDESGAGAGSLSWAVSGALSEAGDQTSYRDLFEKVKLRTAARNIPNSPQAEGDLDRLLFGGQAVNQRPFFALTALDLDDGWGRIEGGALVGLMQGSIVEVHETGTRSPSESTRIATGEITSATPFTAEVDFDTIDKPDATTGRVFMVAPAYGSLRVNVWVDGPDDAAWRNRVVKALRDEAAEPPYLIRYLEDKPVDLVADDATRIVLIREITTGPQVDRGIMLETWENDQQLLPAPLKTNDPILEGRLISRIIMYAQNSYLRGLEATTPGMQVEIDLIPCRLRCSSQEVCRYERCECIEEGDPADFLDEGNNIRLTKGDGFGIRLRNVGSQAAYVSVLDLMPDGAISMIWPQQQTSVADTKLEAARAYRIPDLDNPDRLYVYRACPPFGTDVLKVIATTEWVDFGPITRSSAPKGVPKSPLDALFEAQLTGTKGIRPSFAPGYVTTSEIVITVEDSH